MDQSDQITSDRIISLLKVENVVTQQVEIVMMQQVEMLGGDGYDAAGGDGYDAAGGDRCDAAGGDGYTCVTLGNDHGRKPEPGYDKHRRLLFSGSLRAQWDRL